MTEQEIRRRIDVLNKMEVPMMTQSRLRGGMQSRLHRQEILRHGKEIKKQKKKLQSRLSLIEQEKQQEGFGRFSALSVEDLEDFHEPVFRKMRSKRGFFGY